MPLDTNLITHIPWDFTNRAGREDGAGLKMTERQWEERRMGKFQWEYKVRYGKKRTELIFFNCVPPPLKELHTVNH